MAVGVPVSNRRCSDCGGEMAAGDRFSTCKRCVERIQAAASAGLARGVSESGEPPGTYCQGCGKRLSSDEPDDQCECDEEDESSELDIDPGALRDRHIEVLGISESWTDWLELAIEHYLETDEVLAWVDNAFQPSEARRWIAAFGTSDPEDAVAFRDLMGASAETAAEWYELGYDAPPALHALRLGLTLDIVRRWPEYDPDDIVGFIDLGFTEEAELGALAGRVTPDRLAAEGLPSDPEGLARVAESLAPFFNAGVQTIGAAMLWFDTGMSGSEAGRWHAEGFSPPDVDRWSHSGITDPTEARKWAEHDFTAVAARDWRSNGFDPTTAAAWRAAGLSHETASRRSAAGMRPPLYQEGSGDLASS